MFVLVALTIWCLMNAYVIWRIVRLPKIAGRVPLGAAYFAGGLLAFSWLVARILEALGVRGTAAIEWAGAEWMGLVFLALACFFAADAAIGIGWIAGALHVESARNFVMSHRGAIRAIAFAAAIVLTIAATLNALRPPVVREHEVRVQNLPAHRDGTVAVVISDLHLGSLTSAQWFERRMAEVEALRPDVVLIAGDLIEGDGPPEREFPQMLRQLRAPLGVWAVPGNHERHAGGADAILAGAGIRVLRDESVEIAPSIYIAGVDTVGHERVPGHGLVDRAMQRVPVGSAAILLSHYPQQASIAARRGASLMVAGHTHGGQIWPFDLFVRMAYPYFAGRYDVGGMPLIVCRGTGTWGPKMRLWAPNEMLRIVLRSAGGATSM